MKQMQGQRIERDTYANETRRAGSGSQKRSHVTGLQVGQEFDVEITELGHNGDGMVSIEGYTVFIRNTETGDKVRVKIKKVKDTIAFADRLT
ncbi:TRAM domain-containing protein [Candidatus Woesearchaeota archaeon]|nr:TRAM domain-containing protein [Candidatus Woesearchaeota archaeon]